MVLCLLVTIAFFCIIVTVFIILSAEMRDLANEE